MPQREISYKDACVRFPEEVQKVLNIIKYNKSALRAKQRSPESYKWKISWHTIVDGSYKYKSIEDYLDKNIMYYLEATCYGTWMALIDFDEAPKEIKEFAKEYIGRK